VREGSAWKGKVKEIGKTTSEIVPSQDRQGKLWRITDKEREWAESSNRERNGAEDESKGERKETTETVSSQAEWGKLLNTSRALLESVVCKRHRDRLPRRTEALHSVTGPVTGFCHRDSTENAEGKGERKRERPP